MKQLVRITPVTIIMVILLLSLGSFNIAAQKTGVKGNSKKSTVRRETVKSQVPKTIPGNVINGKAISLPKPSYPKEAKLNNIGGAVNVEVVINETGDVISAKAVSGHPSLQAASVQAASQAKFLPTTLSGVPVRVTGIIVYQFAERDSCNLQLKIVEVNTGLAVKGSSGTAQSGYKTSLLTKSELEELSSFVFITPEGTKTVTATLQNGVVKFANLTDSTFYKIQIKKAGYKTTDNYQYISCAKGKGSIIEDTVYMQKGNPKQFFTPIVAQSGKIISRPNTIALDSVNENAVFWVQPFLKKWEARGSRTLGFYEESIIKITVLIDVEGNVINAREESGHPLLRERCKEAAKRMKFNPTIFNGRLIEVTGMLSFSIKN